MRHINENGRSMVEMLGVLAIIGVLSVGGIAGYSKAMNKYKINKTNDQLSMLIANIRTLFASQSDYSGLNNGTAIKYGVVPNDMYTTASNGTYASNYTISNPFAGDVEIAVSGSDAGHTTHAFTVTYENIPQEACVNIMTSDWGSGQGSGLIAIAVAGADSGDPTTPALGNVFVGADGTKASATGAIATPGGAKQDAPLTVSEAMTACLTKNTIVWKYY